MNALEFRPKLVFFKSDPEIIAADSLQKFKFTLKQIY